MCLQWCHTQLAVTHDAHEAAKPMHTMAKAVLFAAAIGFAALHTIRLHEPLSSSLAVAGL